MMISEKLNTMKYLPKKLRNSDPWSNSILVPVGISFADAQKLLIHRTLNSVNDNKSVAARILGVSRKTLYSKLKGRG